MAGIGVSFNNSLNVGTDISLSILNNSDGSSVILDGKKIRFESNDESHLIESSPIDGGGVPDHRVIPRGWSGMIEVDRANANFGALYAFLEAQFYAGAPQSYFTITETVSNASGTGVARFQYQNVVLHSYKPGTFEKENKVTTSVSFKAAQRVQV